DLFERRLQPMNFVDEKNLSVAKVGQDRRQFTLDLQCRTRCLLEGNAQFVRDDVCKSRLTQARRSVKQNVVQRFSARAGSLNGDGQVLFDLGLSDNLRESLRPQLQFKRRIILNRRGGNHAIALVTEMGSVSERGHGKAIVKRK